MGMIVIEPADSARFKRMYVTKEFEPFRKYLTLMLTDEPFFGVPEIILYPHKIRKFMDVKTSIPINSELAHLKKNEDTYNYFPINIFKHTPMNAKSELSFAMQRYLSSRGFTQDGVTLHMTLDKRTHFYVVYSQTDSKTKKFLVPIQENKKLSFLRKPQRETLFKLVDPEKNNTFLKEFQRYKNKKIE